MRFNDILAVAKRELLVITNYKFLFVFVYLVSFYVGTYLSMGYTNPIPNPQIRLDTYLTFFFLSTEMAFSWSLSTLQIQDYLRQRCMETILATPLSLVSIVLGKSLAIFILSYIPSLVCVSVVFFQANWPLGMAVFVFPSSISLILFLISPILLFGMICVNTLLLMYLNHSIGSLIVNFSVYLLIFRAGANSSLGLGFNVLAGYILATICVYLLTYIGIKFLRKERIVLAI
jgi:hypothetical protein